MLGALRPAKYLRQSGYRAVRVSFRQNVGRQEAQDRVVSTVEEKTVLHPIQHKLLAGEIDFHSNHEARTSDLPNKRKLTHQFRQAHPEVTAHRIDGGQQLIQNVEELQRNATGKRSAAIG